MQGLHLVEVLLTLALLHQYPVGPPGLHVVLCPSVPCLALRLCPQSLSLPHLQPRVAWRGDEASARAISVTSLSPMGRSCPTAQCFSVHIFSRYDTLDWKGAANLSSAAHHKKPAVSKLWFPFSVRCIVCVDRRIDRIASAFHPKALALHAIVCCFILLGL